MNDRQIEQFAKTRYGRLMIAHLDGVCREVADIRTKLNVKPEIDNEVRLGIIQIIEEKIINKLRIMSGNLEPADMNEDI